MKLLSIAKGEVLRSKGRVNVKGLAILLFLGVLFLFLLSSSMKSGGSVLREIYTVGITGENRFLKESLLSDERFRVLELKGSDASRVLESKLDLYIVERGGIIEIYGSEDEKAQGALNALEQAVNYYKLNMIWYVPLEQINDAFPVWIQTHYLERKVEFQYTTISGAKRDFTSLGADIEDLKPVPLDEAKHVQRLEDIREEVGKGGKLSILWERSVVTLPSLLSPPIPLQSALASFLFALPLYLFAQLYSSSMMEERVSRTAQLLLAGPLRRWEIIAGKTLVHFLLTMTAMTGITFLIKGGIDPYYPVSTGSCGSVFPRGFLFLLGYQQELQGKLFSDNLRLSGIPRLSLLPGDVR
jgi:ABC-type Na+ efflux pump permease subunit